MPLRKREYPTLNKKDTERFIERETENNKKLEKEIRNRKTKKGWDNNQ